MTSFREAITGVPEEVQAGVDVDLLATTRGPAALDRALTSLSSSEVMRRYRAALGRLAMAPTTRQSHRRDWADFDRGEDRDEQRQISRGGNR